MIYLDSGKMKEIVNRLYLSHILSAYGEAGVAALKEVLDTLHHIFQFLDPELIKGSLVVFRIVEGKTLPFDLPASERFTAPQYLAQEIASDLVSHTSVVQILENGDLWLWKNLSVDIARLSEAAVVYLYNDRTDAFVIKGSEHIVPNPSPVYSSVFSIPTFRFLHNALEEYKRRWIRTSHCRIFVSAWCGGEGGLRLFFKSKPESTMRRSLAQFLDIVLRGTAEVRPEQVVDETHPVDVKVTWMFTNRLALIEIKWLGKSMNDEGNITKTFTNVRARTGAKQLADYLNSNYAETPLHQSRGYLVVIDGRRKGLNKASTSISLQNGYWYRDKEITYNPQFHLVREDFEEPIRMFAEPKCSLE